MLQKQIQEVILKTFKIENADPAVQDQFLTSFEELANSVVSNLVLETLTNEDIKTFLELLNQDKVGIRAMEFAKGKIPDFESKLTAEIKEQIKKINF